MKHAIRNPTPRPAGGAADDAARAICPRCQRAFDCGAAGPGPCACAGLVVPESVREALRGRYTGCLCLGCLAELSREDAAPPAPAPPASA
ncbi:cysteine-rich CWC family protein [Ideonella sp.]|uniref:cysteine-rich CWC family protein n=1 Tax=Ideonella sp. TaxID=1929293 RepID=UPI0035B3F009